MLKTAVEAAKQAGKIALKYFEGIPKISYKKDLSPVTNADIACEKLIRKILKSKFPDHGFTGEELPDEKADAKYVWIIDPIDGTRDYVRKIPNWSVMIALLEKGKPTLGVIYLPAHKILITGEKGKGTYLNGEKMKVSTVKQINQAYISFGSLKRFRQKNQIEMLSLFSQLCASPRSYGNLGLIYLLQGKVDILLDAHGGAHDFAPTAIIVEEAGGRFSNWKGEFRLDTETGLFTNSLIHNQVLKILNQ